MHIVEPMKNLIRILLLSLPAMVGISLASAGPMPPMDVLVASATGKVAFKGTTNANGTFATGKLEPGKYVVQFNAKGAAVKGKEYSLVVAAGKKKMVAEAVTGEKFAAGGVAMKVDVDPGLNITGQVSSGGAATANSNAKTKIVNGKRYVWVEAETGSHLGGRWVEEGTPEALRVTRMNTEGVKNLQDRGTQGAATGR